MRLRSSILCGALLLLLSHLAGAHGERHLSVIVDTDVALDDIRALGLLVQSEDVDILAVVTSDGACAPEPGARNVRAVLRALGQAGTPVAAGRSLGLPSPPWREMSESLGWSDLGTAKEEQESRVRQEVAVSPDTATELIRRTLRENKTNVTYLCLGPMTNLADVLLADSSLAGRVTSVYYSGSVPGAEPPSWNTARDPAAARAVFECSFPVFSFQVTDEDLLTFDRSFLDAVCGFRTPAAELMCEVHGHERVRRLVQSEHFRCWDEMVILGLLYPELCHKQTARDRLDGNSFTRFDRTAAYIRCLSLLSGDASPKSGDRTPVVLTQYPTDPELLRDDIRPIAPAIIERHGIEEWNAALLANEFHRHLGIYSLIGVKMGIRAREILNTGVDELRVVSYAGSGPPLSCLSDGLQVATGASLGRGSISVEPDKSEPAAVFTKGKTRLRLCLKAEITAQIETDIEDAVRKHGMLTPAYWRGIRKLAVRYWLEMNRREIFDEFFQDPSPRN